MICDIMFVVADQIYLNYQGTLNKMLDMLFNNSNYSIASLMIYRQGQAGNPTIFNACYIEELMKLEGDHGGRKRLLLIKFEYGKDKCLFYQIENELELLDRQIRRFR